MTEDAGQCLKLLLEWRGLKQNELAKKINCDERTIGRIISGETQDVKVKTGVMICFALNLPPIISKKLLDVMHCPLNLPRNQEHMWINEALNLKYPEPMEAILKYLAAYGVKI